MVPGKLDFDHRNKDNLYIFPTCGTECDERTHTELPQKRIDTKIRFNLFGGCTAGSLSRRPFAKPKGNIATVQSWNDK